MSSIRYKRFGRQDYAYEITSYWDSKKKISRQKTRYLGVVIDKSKGLYEKKARKTKAEKLILDFGDCYLIQQFLEKNGFLSLIKEVFDIDANFLLTLLCYRLCYPSAMMYADTWRTGNMVRLLFKDVDASSQRISEFFSSIGDESIQRRFFQRYIPEYTNSKKGVIIDTSALPNQIHMPLNAWGYGDDSIDKQIRFLLVVDQGSSLPLFFRTLPGNVVDVSSLKTTVEELKKYGVKQSFVLIDAGFFSEDNIKDLYKEDIPFLTRLPAIRVLYKQLIKDEVRDIEKFGNAVKYGKRGLFIKQKKVDLFGKSAYAHIVLDPERKGREIKKMLVSCLDEKSQQKKEEIEYHMLRRGIMILISSFEIKKEEVVPIYYVRQNAEKLFGFSKDDLKLIPLRVHSEETLRGFLFVQFISLIIFVLLKQKLGKDYTVEEVLLTLRNLKCKVYDDEIIIQEVTKQQREILEKLKILVPNKLGI